MSANVETMFYTREKPWHGLGTRVEEAPTSSEAIRLAGLDWTVEPKQISLLGESTPINNVVANVRTSDGTVLGFVTERYKAVQNIEAFAFTDTLIGGDVHYETAGSLRNGRQIWLLAKMPNTSVAGDEVEPYLCFTNTHDGTGAVRVCMTPVRVVCNNTLNMAFNGAVRSWGVFHTGSIYKKIEEAKQTLELANRYMTDLDEYAKHMINVKVDEVMLKNVLDEMFKPKDKTSERQIVNAAKNKENYMVCYYAPDIEKFRGTAWGALNAMTDMIGHMEPNRKTKNFEENRWGKIMQGHPLVAQMATMISK